MSTAALLRRLSRIEAERSPSACPACDGRRGGVQFIMHDEQGRPGAEVETCAVCGGPLAGTIIHIRPLGAPPVAPRSPVAATAGAGVQAGAQPPGPPYRPTGASRGP